MHLYVRASTDPRLRCLTLRPAALALRRIINGDNVIDALEKKVAQMEQAHKEREADWHKLANSWIQYEKDLHAHSQK